MESNSTPPHSRNYAKDLASTNDSHLSAPEINGLAEVSNRTILQGLKKRLNNGKNN